MPETPTRDRVRAVIARELGAETATMKDHVRLDDLGADSLDVVCLVMELETRYQIMISDEAAAEFKTVGDVVNHLCAR
jgi:acyl carrier protein